MKNTPHFIKIILLLVLILFFDSCESDENFFFVDTNNTRTLEDVEDDFKNIEFYPGINDLTIEGTFNNVFWNFRVIVPESANPLNKRPLIVRLHGAASLIDPDLHKTTACLFEPGYEALDAIIISPNSDGFIWYDLPNQNKVTTLTNLVRAFLPVDEDKIVITGYSDGGNGAWFYAQNYPQIYSAAIPIATSYDPVRADPNISVKIDIPLYVIHGEEDQLFPLEITQGYIDTTVAAGTNLEFVIAPGLEHYNSCVYVPYLQGAVDWLENTVWN